MTTTNDKPRWTCSYRGNADYLWRGQKWRVRSHACPGGGATATSADGHYNGDYYFKGILPAVGTVMADDSERFHQFPPAELMAHFPLYVGARWLDDFSAIVYDGPAPEHFTLPWGDVTTPAIHEESERFWRS
jgi:hypothetical protein